MSSARCVACRSAREPLPWAHASAAMTRGALHVARGQALDAVEEFAAAARGFEGLSMPLYAAAARRRQGERMGSLEGSAIVRAADLALAARGVKNAARMTDTMVPRVRG